MVYNLLFHSKLKVVIYFSFWGKKTTDKFSLKEIKDSPIYFIIWAVFLVIMTNFSCIAVADELYTIHCASYQTKQQAAEDAQVLTTKGYPAFFMPVEIKEKGKWYRVLSGKYGTKEKARLAAAEMVKKSVLSKYFILPLSADQKIPDKKENISREISSAEKPTVVIANSDSKRYHLAGMPFYDKVKPYHRVLFNSEKEAIDAGYYKASGVNQRSMQKKQAAAPKNRNSSAKSDFSQVNTEKQPGSVKAKTQEKKIQLSLPAILGKDSGKAGNNEQLPAEKEEPGSGSVLYDRALSALKEKNYLQALATFKEFVARDDTSKDLGEKALRHMADCHFFLGEKGSKENLRIAVEFYKNTLQSFPDEKRENALVYFRLARAYEYLNNYSDALINYENLLNKYPQSAYAPESSFKVGAQLHQIGKYNQAVDKLIAYLMKNRGGDFARQSFYLVADSYYKMQQSATAEIWYRDAQKKWSDFMDIPRELVLNMGQHKLTLRRYDEAINLFSLYANVYADDEKIKEALLLLGDSYKAADQVSAALNTYNLIIDKYPESREAAKSIIAMAGLGIDRPGVKVFSALKNIHYYKAPLEAYDILLAKNPPVEIAQSALLHKGNALHKLQNDGKAFDIYLEFLRIYPQSRFSGEAKKSLKQAAATLVDKHYQQKDYLTVADIYFKAYRSVPLQSDEYSIVNKIASSLSNLSLSEECIKLLKNYRNVCRDEKVVGTIMLGIAEEEMAGKKYDEAEKILGELMMQPVVKNTPLMTAAKKNMAEIAYQRKLYDKAVVDFDAVINSGHDINNPGSTFWHYAASLKEKKEDSLALKNYLLAVKYLNQDGKQAAVSGEAYKEAGDLYFKVNNYRDSLSMYNRALVQSSNNTDLKHWSLFHIGRSYLKMNNSNEAQKTFTKIKNESGAEGFWTRVVDYYVNDENWWDKYGEHLKN